MTEDKNVACMLARVAGQQHPTCVFYLSILFSYPCMYICMYFPHFAGWLLACDLMPRSWLSREPVNHLPATADNNLSSAYGVRNTGSMGLPFGFRFGIGFGFGFGVGSRVVRVAIGSSRGGCTRDFGPVMAQVAYKWSLMSSCQIELSAG